MPKSVGGHGELQRHEEAILPGCVDVVLLDGLVHHLGIGDPLQEVLENDVLVVLAQKLPSPYEILPLVHQPVVSAQEGDVQLGDDEILIVSRVADPGLAVALGVLGLSPPSREVVEDILALGTITACGYPPDPHLVVIFVISRCWPAVDAV